MEVLLGVLILGVVIFVGYWLAVGLAFAALVVFGAWPFLLGNL
jgi:hypothetical protein